jgi:hypothetical protein
MKQKVRGFVSPKVKAGLVFHHDRWNAVRLFLWTALLFAAAFKHCADNGDSCPYRLTPFPAAAAEHIASHENLFDVESVSIFGRSNFHIDCENCLKFVNRMQKWKVEV